MNTEMKCNYDCVNPKRSHVTEMAKKIEFENPSARNIGITVREL